jgi:hypothetical protein
MPMMYMFLITALFVSSSAALAQQTLGPPGEPTRSPPPLAGPPPISGPGSNEVVEDGVTAKRAKTVRCSTAARETDGTTACIGIPDDSARKNDR